MRLTRIEFHGYKRLAATACNVDSRLLAVLGPNEAGKSSVLEGLHWLSETDSGPLSLKLRSRALGDLPGNRPVVTAQYTLDDDDRAALADLDTDVVPVTYRHSKTADGTYQAVTKPTLIRRTAVLEEAAVELARVSGRYELVRTEGKTGTGDWLDAAVEALGEGDEEPTAEAVSAFGKLSAWLREPEEVEEKVDGEPGEGDLRPEDDAVVADLLDAAIAKLQEPNVAALAREKLGARRPEFLMFQEPDRVLESSYELSDRTLAASPPPALRNLLKIAGTTFAEIRATQASGDASRLRTLLKRSNLELASRLEPMWGQNSLAAQIETNGTLLELFIEELGADGAVTEIAERSDGLRTFVALVCFLADKAAESESDVPPVLLIDEAETHLHYDAQADLLDVLLNDVRTSSVIYTTHSPGCLPPDLGTGIRLVAPDPKDRAVSNLRADFWHKSSRPGFSPLLFAMGASAAAFSVCRRAVLAEGASDMILLPSMLRKATGETELGYQVAPGLAMGTADLADADIAARVAFLADGDSAGEKYRSELAAQNVDPTRVHLLPEGKAIEDLLTEPCWFGAVRALMTDAGYTGPPLTSADLPGTGPIAKRLKNWSKANDCPAPGKAAVASYLVQDPTRIVLTAQGKTALRALHTAISEELNRPASGLSA